MRNQRPDLKSPGRRKPQVSRLPRARRPPPRTPPRTAAPRCVNTSAVTFGGLPAAAPVTTNRTELNWAASASTADRSAAPDATTTLQPRTSSVPANGAACAASRARSPPGTTPAPRSPGRRPPSRPTPAPPPGPPAPANRSAGTRPRSRTPAPAAAAAPGRPDDHGSGAPDTASPIPDSRHGRTQAQQHPATRKPHRQRLPLRQPSPQAQEGNHHKHENEANNLTRTRTVAIPRQTQKP